MGIGRIEMREMRVFGCIYLSFLVIGIEDIYLVCFNIYWVKLSSLLLCIQNNINMYMKIVAGNNNVSIISVICPRRIYT